MIKIFTPLEKGLGNWINNNKEVNSLEEADIVMLPGGSDLNPAVYGHSPLPTTFINQKADTEELWLADAAIGHNKFIIGVCKGSQLLTALAGGWLIQDVDGHHNHHEIETYDGKTFTVNSSHHQMCYPYDLKAGDFKMLGWANDISSKYLIGTGQDLNNFQYFVEPEVIWYPKIKGLAIQSHPEWTSMPADFNEWLNELILKLIKKTII